MTARELELRDQRGELLEQITALRDGIKAEGRNVTATEQQEIESKFAQVTKLSRDIAEAEAEGERKHQELDRELRGGERRFDEESTGPLETRKHAELCRRTGIDANDMNGWRDSREFWSTVFSGRGDDRLYRSQNTRVPQEGGIIVPEKVAGRIFDLALENEIVRPRARIYPIQPGEGRTLGVPIWDGYDRSNGNITGTVKLAWVAEGGSISTTQAKFTSLKLDLKKAAALVPMSNEVMSDSPNFVTDMESAIAQAIAFGVDDVLLNGLGSATPEGALQGPSVVEVAKETGQGAATIVLENILKMQSRMLPSSLMSGAVWVAHPGCYPALSTLVLAVGTGGSVVRLLEGNARTGFTLNGLPLIFTEKAQVIGQPGDLSLCDFNRYAILQRPGMRIDMSPHLGFQTDETYLRVVMRIDGKAVDPAATTPLRGETFGPFVTLAERA